MYQEKIRSRQDYSTTNNNHNNKSFDFNCYVWDNPIHNRKDEMTIKTNQKFKIKYTKQDGEEVRRFGIITDECRGLGNRQKDNRPFLHYYDLDKKGYRYATNWEIL